MSAQKTPRAANSKKAPQNAAPILQPQKAPPVDCEELIRAVEVINRAGRGEIATPDPGRFGVNLVQADGSVVGLRFTDLPINRAVFAVRDQFQEDDQWQNLLYRYFALCAAIKDWQADLAPWLQRDVRATLLHRAILEAAAVAPVTRNVTFRRKPFLGKIAEYYAQAGGGE
jgi:hypothetical protein